MGEAVGIKNTKDVIVYSTNFGGGRCSSDTHRLYIWLALDGGFGWPAAKWVERERRGNDREERSRARSWRSGDPKRQ